MRKKKEVEKKVEYEEIGIRDMWCGKEAIPEGATHFELEMDYSGCYYESDSPSCKVRFFKPRSKQ